MKSITLAILSLFLFSSGYADEKAPSKNENKVLESSDAAPDFSLKGADGKMYSLKDLKGKVVVLEWFNNECPYVEKHYGTQNMQKLQEKYTKEGVAWLTVSSTKSSNALTADEAKKIIKERSAHQTALLLDSDGTVARLYGAKTTPHMFIINKDGKIAYNGAIDDNTSFRKDTVSGAKNYVSEALDVLLGKSNKKTIEHAETKPYGCSVKI